MLLRLINPFQKNDQKLAKQLLISILLFSSFFTLLAAIVQLWVDYHKDLGLIEKQIHQISESYMDSLSLSIWNMNEKHLYAQLNGILQLPEISCIEAKTIDALYRVGQKPLEGSRISFVFPIVYKDTLQQFSPEQVGTLTIYGDLGYIRSRLKERILVIITTQTFKTFSVSVFILFVVWRLITQYLHIMADYVRKLNVDTLNVPLVLNRRPPKGKRDSGENEIFMVADAINDMRENLGSANESLRRHRDQLEEKVAERTSLLEIQAVELRNAKESAEAASQAKSDFLANMSHEIRTPMNAILGFAEILSGMESDRQKKIYFKAIESNGQALMSLINDILDLASIEAGKMKLEYKVISPELLFNDVRNLFMVKAEEKGIELIVDIPPGLPSALLLDAVRLRQILVNLVGNALKFTTQGYVRLSIHHSSPDSIVSGLNVTSIDLSFSVEDSGVGIPPDQIDLVFDTFTQVKGQKFSDHGGTGLGLSITRKLVEMMGGSISLESEVGKGSRFTIDLKNIEVPSVIDGLEDKKARTGDFDLIRFEKATLLIVDDIDYNRELLKGFIEGFGLTLIEAENGREAIEKSMAYSPDLIMMDMKMPVMDGYKAVEILKQHPELSHIPIVAITATAMKEDEKLIRRMCQGYLSKPLRRADFISMLMRCLPHTLLEGGMDDQAGRIGAGSAESKPRVVKNILFVDDEVMLTKMGNHMLTYQGYTVDTYNDPVMALEDFRTRSR
ncbi:MAG: response regulator, partial [Proteobacteria bacterium]|nr:response regulator [Pseudomonadota bacterium]